MSIIGTNNNSLKINKYENCFPYVKYSLRHFRIKLLRQKIMISNEHKHSLLLVLSLIFFNTQKTKCVFSVSKYI